MTDHLGWIIVTRQRDGSWQDDWDGAIHATREEADASLAEATSALGAEFVRLAEVTSVFGGTR